MNDDNLLNMPFPPKTYLYFSVFILLLSSCQFNQQLPRFTISLSDKNATILEGKYELFPYKQDNFNLNLIHSFESDTSYYDPDSYVELSIIDKKNIQLELFENDSLIKNINIKGKYSKNAFVVTSKGETDMIWGPILWTLGSASKTKLMLSDNKDLIIKKEGNGGVMFFIIIPIMSAGGGDIINEYKRIN